MAVEGAHRTIVATEVSSNASDQGRMVPLVDEVEATHGERPETVLADAGYCNEADLQALEARGVDGYVALGREGRSAVAVDAAKHPAKARMAQKLSTDAGRALYAQRKWLSEAPNGCIEEALGFRRFGLRGLNEVRGERDLRKTRVDRATRRAVIILFVGEGAYRCRKKTLAPVEAAGLRRRSPAGEGKTGLAREYGVARQTLYR